jgi:hypothetical protein
MDMSESVSPLLLLPSLGPVLVVLGFVIGWKISERPPWSAFLWGLLAFIVSATLKVVFSLFLSDNIMQWMMVSAPEGIGEVAFWAYLIILTPITQAMALTTMPGILEILVILIFTRIVAKGNATWKQATFFGIGFATIWPIFAGLLGLMSPLRALIVPAAMNPMELASLQAASGTPDLIFWVTPDIVERAAIVAAYVCVASIIFFAARSRIWLALAGAFVYSALLSGMFLWRSSVSMAPDLLETWTSKAILAIVGIVGLIIATMLQRWYPVATTEVGKEPEPEVAWEEPPVPLMAGFEDSDSEAEQDDETGAEDLYEPVAEVGDDDLDATYDNSGEEPDLADGAAATEETASMELAQSPPDESASAESTESNDGQLEQPESKDASKAETP